MSPEQRRFLRAYLRATGWAIAAGLVALGFLILLRPPFWAFVLVFFGAPIAVLWLLTRDERRELSAQRRAKVAALREERAARGEPPPPRPTKLQWIVVLFFGSLPVIGAALMILGHGAVRYVGLGLLGLFVFERAVLVPWRAIRHHRRQRESRAR